MIARRSWIDLTYQGKNITADISGDGESVSYEEGFGEADLINLTVQDRSDKWLRRWRPKTGERLKLTMRVSDWRRPGDNWALRCGHFQVDSLEYSAPPRILQIGGNSMPVDTAFIGVKHNRTWKKVTLKNLLFSMLPKDFTLSWQSEIDIELAYVEQSDTADLEFIMQLCEKYGFRLKILNSRLAVFNAQELDAAPAVRTFSLSELDGSLAGWRLNRTSTRTEYDACKIKYQNTRQGKELSHTFSLVKTPKKYMKRPNPYTLWLKRRWWQKPRSVLKTFRLKPVKLCFPWETPLCMPGEISACGASAISVENTVLTVRYMRYRVTGTPLPLSCINVWRDIDGH